MRPQLFMDLSRCKTWATTNLQEVDCNSEVTFNVTKESSSTFG